MPDVAAMSKALTRVCFLCGCAPLLLFLLLCCFSGVPLKWYGPPSFTYTEVVRCAAHFLHFARKAQQYYEESLVPGQSLTTIRLRTKDNDIMIAPGEHVIFIAFQEVSQPDAKEDEAKKEE